MKFKKHKRRYLKKRISALRDMGLSFKEIALKLKISECSVYRLKSPNPPLGKEAVFFPKGNARASKITRDTAIRGRGAGLTVACVAWMFRVSPSTIYRWQKEAESISDL